jgi:cytochrome oxidase assembly protein ShyY1
VTSVTSADSNCNTHKFSIARRQERSIRSFAMSIAKHLMWFTSLTHFCRSQYVGESVQPFNKRIDLILLSCRLAMENLCVLQLESALVTLVTTWFTLAAALISVLLMLLGRRNTTTGGSGNNLASI